MTMAASDRREAGEKSGPLGVLFGLWLFTLALGYATRVPIAGIHPPPVINGLFMGWFPFWLLLARGAGFIGDGLLFGAFRPRWMPALFVIVASLSALLSIEPVFALLNTGVLWASLATFVYMWRTPHAVFQGLRTQALLMAGYFIALPLVHLLMGEPMMRAGRLSLSYNTVILSLLAFQIMGGALLMRPRWLRWALTVGVFGVALFSGTRNILLALILTSGLFAYLQALTRRPHAALTLHRHALVAALGFALLSAAFAVSAMGYFKLADLPGAIGRGGTSLLQRFELWANGLAIWRQYPLLGVGPGQQFLIMLGEAPLADPLPFAVKNWHAHNVVIALLADLGLTGLLAWLMLMARGGVVIIRRWWRHRPPELTAMLAFGGGLFIPFMLEGLAFREGNALWLLALLLALLPEDTNRTATNRSAAT